MNTIRINVCYKSSIIFLSRRFIFIFSRIFQTLYSSLSSILDNNPFQNDDIMASMTSLPALYSSIEGYNLHDTLVPRVSDVLYIYTQTLITLKKLRLHEGVVSQLFSYLFYFTSTELFNTIMTKGMVRLVNTFTMSNWLFTLYRCLFRENSQRFKWNNYIWQFYL